MKIYIVFNNEFMEGIRGVFAKEEDAKRCISENVNDYLTPGETKTLNDMFRICIEEHDLIDSDTFIYTSHGTKEKLNEYL